jgi:hypothetical protein
MPSTLPASSKLAANRMVKLVGAVLFYAQPGDVAFGCTIAPSDDTSFATRILLVDESPWPVQAQGTILASGTCVIGVDGVAVAGGGAVVGEAIARAADGLPFPMVTRTQTSASGFQPATLYSPEPVSRALVSDDDAHTLVCTGALAFTVPAGLVAGFGVAAKGTCSFVAGAGAVVNDVRAPGAINPWCALVQIGLDTYDVVGGMP